jgi:hypothetical protein
MHPEHFAWLGLSAPFVSGLCFLITNLVREYRLRQLQDHLFKDSSPADRRALIDGMAELERAKRRRVVVIRRRRQLPQSESHETFGDTSR